LITADNDKNELRAGNLTSDRIRRGRSAPASARPPSLSGWRAASRRSTGRRRPRASRMTRGYAAPARS